MALDANNDGQWHDDDEPPTRLMELSRVMLAALEEHPDGVDRVQAVVCLADPVTGEGLSATRLLDTPLDAVNMMLGHAEALAKTYGVTIAPPQQG